MQPPSPVSGVQPRLDTSNTVNGQQYNSDGTAITRSGGSLGTAHLTKHASSGSYYIELQFSTSSFNRFSVSLGWIRWSDRDSFSRNPTEASHETSCGPTGRDGWDSYAGRQIRWWPAYGTKCALGKSNGGWDTQRDRIGIAININTNTYTAYKNGVVMYTKTEDLSFGSGFTAGFMIWDNIQWSLPAPADYLYTPKGYVAGWV